MKRFLTRLGAVFLGVMLLALVGCGTPEEEQPEEQISYEIAMVTDSGLIMDGSYSEVAWNAITEFGADQGVSHKYYKAAEATNEAYRAVIDTAVSKGAKVIVADGYSFEDVVYNAQNDYTDVNFILIDAEPVEAESGETKINDNTAAILFSSEQAGYLAGYGAVMEGMTRLGFIGDAKKPAIIDYGYGFLQGAEAAAAELDVAVSVRTHYCEKEHEREATLEKAAKWYQKKTEVIFACGKQVEMPVIEAAELTDRKVIACETDKSEMSDTVLTSAAKDITAALKNTLEQYEDEEFPGGEVIRYDATNDGIWLEMENGRFSNFTKGAYKKAYGQLADGTVTVTEYDIGNVEGLKLEHVMVREE